MTYGVPRKHIHVYIYYSVMIYKHSLDIHETRDLLDKVKTKGIWKISEVFLRTDGEKSELISKENW